MRKYKLAFFLGFLLLAGGFSYARGVEATREAFRSWLRVFKSVAVEKGIKADVYDKLTADLTPDFSLPDLDIAANDAKSSQPEQAEFVKTPEQYLGEKHLSVLVAQGRKLLAQHDKTLARIKSEYGVEPTLLLALWGRETAFGDYRLPHNALQVLAVQAYAGRRKELFQAEFIDALRMVQENVIQPQDMRSSWAGAMGLVQFMPSDYWKYGVSANGGGRPDIWKSVPDALASLAKNLKAIGWKAGQPWGFEVDAPATVDCSLANLDERKTVAQWQALGVAPVQGGGFNAELLQAEASLLMPAGVYGPKFLTFDNFQVIREYNRSDLYALFVGHLADRIGGGGGFARHWERVTQVPSRDVEDLQKRLGTLGLYRDTIDGKAGGRTRSAVGRYQKQTGLAQTCWPTAEVIAYLRKSSSLNAPASAGEKPADGMRPGSPR